MPAYDRVVGSKPPFAYESAKTAAAIPSPAAVSRRSRLCSRFTLPHGTARYSTGVLRGLSKGLLVAAILAAAALSVPTAAFACGGGPSAYNVYKECLPTGGGSKPTGQKSSGGPTTTRHVSPRTAKALHKAGRKDRHLLSRLVNSYNTNPRPFPSGGSGSAPPPSALGSAFDLGSGPTALLAILAATAVLLLAASGLRGWRHWRRG
jgi:hypothetical protein